MKYDELTLMQFVDGELDEALAAEIDSARLKDRELQAHIEVYEATRSALIDSSLEEVIPSHISEMIDNYSPVKKQNWLTKMITNNPFKTSIFSAILASLVTFQGVLVATGGMFTASQLVTRGIEVTPDINGLMQNIDSDDTVHRAVLSEGKLTKVEIEEEINKALLTNQNVPSVVIKIGNKMKTLYFLERFTDKDGNNCKVVQIDDQLLITCRSDDSIWTIKSY